MYPKFLSFALISVVSAVSVIVIDQKPSYAWMDICNQSGETLYVAFGYLDTPDNRVGSGGGGWVAQGWQTVNPSDCARVYEHELWRRNRYYYYTAYNASRTKVWGSGGNTSFCITNENFRLPQTSTVSEQCGGDIVVTSLNCGGGRLSCSSERSVIARRTYWQKFGVIDIGSGRVQNYSHRLGR
jgi:uncharacterized membrane protein